MADHENEDNEIDQHLLQKIRDAIEKSGENQVTKLFLNLLNTLTKKPGPANVNDWLSVRRANLYCLNNLLTEWQMIKNQSSSSQSSQNLIKSLNNLKEELGGSESSSKGDDKSARDHQETSDHDKVYRWSSRHGPRKVHGFEHMVMVMERDLVMRDAKVLGVAGVAGIGKTTLCQYLFGRKLVKEHFSPRIWVCLSQQPRDRKDYKEEILVRILMSLGVEDEIISDAAKDSDRLRKLILLLRLQLTGRRYLIVLDDAWNEDKFFLKLTQKEQLDENWGEELAYGLPKGCGGAIISSSRSSELLKKMLGKHVILQDLKPHTDDIIKDIFREAVIGYDEDEREFQQHLVELEKEILKKCDGIPLAAKLFAKIARDQLPKPEPQATAGGVERLIGRGNGVEDGRFRSDGVNRRREV